MAEFFGEIESLGGSVASRCGNKKSGIKATCRHLLGDVRVRMWTNNLGDHAGEPYVWIYAFEHNDDAGTLRTVYRGRLAELVAGVRRHPVRRGA